MQYWCVSSTNVLFSHLRAPQFHEKIDVCHEYVNFYIITLLLTLLVFNIVSSKSFIFSVYLNEWYWDAWKYLTVNMRHA